MSTNKVTSSYILKEETNALGAAQIMLGLIHNALGILWLSLHGLEEKKHSIGSELMITSICYLFISGSFLVLAIIANTASIFVALFGIMLFGFEFPIFEAIGTEYIWSNMAGMMLLQMSVVCTIAELIIAIIVLHWFVTSCKVNIYEEEISLDPPSKSLPELENVSEDCDPEENGRRK